MKSLFIFLILSVTHLAFADGSFTLLDNNSGIRYQCGSGSSTGDPNCISEVGSACELEHNSWCFESAVKYCKQAPSGFGSCVKSTTEYCRHTNNSWCFESALKACRGNVQDLIQFIDKLKENAMLKEMKSDTTARKSPWQ